MNVDVVADTDRLAKERAFHDARFEGGDQREAQMKFYWAIERGATEYGDAIRRLAVGADVLEYGCANGTLSEELGPSARSVEAIDISAVAIGNARARGGPANVRYHVMDAMQMTFADAQFDLVFGSGIVHHLDTDRAASEVARVLRPGGHALFWEPMGLNPAINLYRRATPEARTEDEHPLVPADFRIMRAHFATVQVRYFGLASLAAVPLRSVPGAKVARKILDRIDEAVLSVPGVRNLAWYCLLDCTR